jgi:hypothetical protein
MKQREGLMSSLEAVQIDQLPGSIEEYLSLRDEMARTPQGGAVMMVIALLLCAKDEELGRQCLTVAVDRSRLAKGSGGYRGWQLLARDMSLIQTQIDSHPHIPRSYVRGATPENRYELPELPFVFELPPQAYSGDPDSGTYKAFLVCSGASRPRPVTLHRNERGIWKAYEWSSLIVGVKEPKREDKDDL